MKALILGSGFGTRLHPITKITPKLLIDIDGKPLLAHLLKSLEKSKYIDEVCIAYSSKFKSQFASYIEHFKHKKKIRLITNKTISESPSSIGTINSFVRLKKLKENLLVLAGDSLFSFDVDDFIRFFKKHKKTCVAIYNSKNKLKIAKRYGIVKLNKNHKIINFEEKPSKPKTNLIATLCYIISNSDMHHLNKGTFKENAGELIKHLVENGQGVYGFRFRGKWFDIGTHEDLERARREF